MDANIVVVYHGVHPVVPVSTVAAIREITEALSSRAVGMGDPTVSNISGPRLALVTNMLDTSGRPIVTGFAFADTAARAAAAVDVAVDALAGGQPSGQSVSSTFREVARVLPVVEPGLRYCEMTRASRGTMLQHIEGVINVTGAGCNCEPTLPDCHMCTLDDEHFLPLWCTKCRNAQVLDWRTGMFIQTNPNQKHCIVRLSFESLVAPAAL